MKRTLYSGTGLLLVGLLFLVFNLLSGLLLRNLQVDLTQQKLYTFSDGTREILDQLDEPLNLYLFFSKSRAGDLVALRNYARRVEEVLDLYVQRSHGKIRLFVIDPLPFSDDEDRASRFGLQALPLGPNEEGIYFGLAATNATDGIQVIPFFSPEEEPLLEYDLSRLVQALAERERTVVGLMSSLPMNGQAATDSQPGSRPWAMMDKLHQQFDIRTLGLATTEIPAEISVLMLVHPRQLSEPTLRAIDRFVLRGGKLLAFVDPLSLADPSADKGSDLSPLLRAWGVQLRPDTLLADAAFAMIRPNAERRPERNPTWLHLPGHSFPQNNVLTTGLEGLNLATAGLLEPLAEASTRFIPLMYSSERSMPLSLERFQRSTTDELNAALAPTGERYVLAAKLEGPAKSAFAPEPGKPADGPAESANIHVLLVADSDLLSDPLWLQEQAGPGGPRVWADNDLFVGNALDYLSGSDALIDLRSRGHTNRPFTRVEELRREAGMRVQEQLNVLQQSLNDTEKNLQELQQSMDGAEQDVTPEMEATLRRFVDDKLRIRQQLRQLQFQLNADIDRLAEQVKLVNTVLVPALLTFLLLLHWTWRRLRRRSA
ncbi:GldG family protein [Pseudomonas paraeruginosa]|uniref:ABC transporter n=2 Tax=Pseudomonas aeruginosa TaxID=287 RepID=A0ABD7JTR2_PSEAI|nr:MULTISPECIES: Gldg family protein [Pseudomonas aeruginosa group]KFF35676.1 ABC transporter [Pseudomonas aeruginosa VRFPA01]RTR90291.1 ABC transporter [Pseudomonas paraeruginosa]RTS39764.1 ABC transporter [Pseudomonas aeruginosa]